MAWDDPTPPRRPAKKHRHFQVLKKKATKTSPSSGNFSTGNCSRAAAREWPQAQAEAAPRAAKKAELPTKRLQTKMPRPQRGASPKEDSSKQTCWWFYTRRCSKQQCCWGSTLRKIPSKLPGKPLPELFFGISLLADLHGGMLHLACDQNFAAGGKRKQRPTVWRIKAIFVNFAFVV